MQNLMRSCFRSYPSEAIRGNKHLLGGFEVSVSCYKVMSRKRVGALLCGHTGNSNSDSNGRSNRNSKSTANEKSRVMVTVLAIAIVS